jgi:hypothetical protein
LAPFKTKEQMRAAPGRMRDVNMHLSRKLSGRRSEMAHDHCASRKLLLKRIA